MQTADIIDAIGRRKLSEALGVGLTAVSNAAVSGKFPAAWYLVVRDLCDRDGLDCPMAAFNWRSPSQHPSQEAS